MTKKQLLELRPDIEYVPTSIKLDTENLHMIGRVQSRYAVEGDMGKIFRALRYRNLYEAVAERYCGVVPQSVITAICAHESCGGELLCNSVDDGGIGGQHMQGATGRALSLHTYDDCNAIICNGVDTLSCTRIDTVRGGKASSLDYQDAEVLDYTGTDPHDNEETDSTAFTLAAVKKNHGAELRALYEKNKDNPQKLCELDDRFNLLLNADASVRLILYYMPESAPEGFSSPLEYAVYRYSGNKRDFWNSINNFANQIQDPDYLLKIEETFNKLNPDFMLNGKKADYNDLMQFYDNDNNKYGLEKYKKLGKIKVD